MTDEHLVCATRGASYDLTPIEYRLDPWGKWKYVPIVLLIIALGIGIFLLTRGGQ